MNEIILIAAVIVCLAFWVGVILYGHRFSSKQGDSRSKSTGRLFKFGMLGAIVGFMVDAIPSGTKRTYHDKTWKKTESLEDKKEAKHTDAS